MSASPSSESPPQEAWFREHEPFLRQLARRYLSPFLRTQLDSVDLVQSVWVHFLRRKDLKTDPASARGLLGTMLRHRIIDHVRRMKASRRREQSSDADADRAAVARPSELAQANELWERMQHLCPPQHREILRMKQQGLPLEEIAEQTRLHPSSVRRVLYELARRLAVEAAARRDVP